MNKRKKGENIIYLCDGKKCNRYNDEAKSSFSNLLCKNKGKDSFTVEKMKCQGMCKKAPVVYISSEDVYKSEVYKKQAQKIYEKYVG